MLQGQWIGDVVQVSVANLFQPQRIFQISRAGRDHKKVIVGIVTGVDLSRREHGLQKDDEPPARVAGERHFQVEIGAGDRPGHGIMEARDLGIILGLVFQPDFVKAGRLIELLQQRDHALNVRRVGRKIGFRNSRLECRRITQFQRQ